MTYMNKNVIIETHQFAQWLHTNNYFEIWHRMSWSSSTVNSRQPTVIWENSPLDYCLDQIGLWSCLWKNCLDRPVVLSMKELSWLACGHIYGRTVLIGLWSCLWKDNPDWHRRPRPWGAALQQVNLKQPSSMVSAFRFLPEFLPASLNGGL